MMKEAKEHALDCGCVSCAFGMDMRWILIPGTWANSRNAPKDEWWKDGSDFRQALTAHGANVELAEMGAWNTQLDGVVGSNTDWEHAGEDLAKRLAGQERVSLICHSHGGNVWPYAAEAGCSFDTVITMATPVRADVPYASSRPWVKRWLHVYGDIRDWVQILGEAKAFSLFALHRKMKLADKNIEIPEAGHSDLHTVAVWDHHGLWKLLGQ